MSIVVECIVFLIIPFTSLYPLYVPLLKDYVAMCR